MKDSEWDCSEWGSRRSEHDNARKAAQAHRTWAEAGQVPSPYGKGSAGTDAVAALIIMALLGAPGVLMLASESVGTAGKAIAAAYLIFVVAVDLMALFKTDLPKDGWNQ